MKVVEADEKNEVEELAKQLEEEKKANTSDLMAALHEKGYKSLGFVTNFWRNLGLTK